MRINRIICVSLIIGSGVFASYYGGNISYALFYLSILVPVIAFLYTVYVYIQFKLYQSMGSYMVVKGDWTDYSFIIANEDFITFRNVKCNFLSDKSTIEATNETAEYSLLPSESERMETRIKCNYRGEYYVGVDSVEITDFLYLFTITYPVGTKLKAVVLPRVVYLEQLGIAPPQIDVKNPLRFSNTAEEELDTEMRKYNPGDNRKRIHWKASARQNELMSRKYQHKPKAEIFLFMDLMQVKEDELDVIKVEDKIIESILAISNFYALRGTPSEIIYEMNGKKQISIRAKEDFNAFYKACVSIHFQSKTPVSDLIRERLLRGEEGKFYVVATHFLSEEFYLALLKVLGSGNHLSVLFISDDISENTSKLIDSLRSAGAGVYQVMSQDEIDSILSTGI